MIRLPRLTPRQMLIVVHDLVATAAAILASFYVRFEEKGLVERWDYLITFLPLFVLYAAVVYFIFGLYRAKWRFASLPDLQNIFRASTVLALSLLVLDYILVTPGYYGQFFFGKITIALYWLLQMAFLGGPRIAYRYFRYSRTRLHARREDFDSDPGARPRRRCRSAAARDRKRRGAENLAGRHPVAVAGGSRPGHPRHQRARQFRRSQSARLPISPSAARG